MATTDGDAGPRGLDLHLEKLLHDLSEAKFVLQSAGVEDARTKRAQLVTQVSDYILPRYRSFDAPLLAVVGGSTGAGKSTLVNALVGRVVTRAGAIRPTTRQPILLHHPSESAWFDGDRILPALPRVTGTAAESAPPAGGAEGTGTESLLLVADDVVPRGIALLDAPDIDSVSDGNRRLARQLLAAADLWLFVTTANRYADAVPWALLKDAAARDITVAVVLDRIPPGVEDEVADDLRAMLAAQGLGAAKLFTVPETPLGPDGLLPADAVAGPSDWLRELAGDAAVRSEIARRTLAGVVAQLAGRVEELAAAEDQQHEAAARLRADVDAAFNEARSGISRAAGDGTLLRGEVLARWQDFVGTGEFFRSLESGIGRLRDRIGAFLSGRPQPVKTVEEAIESGLHAVVVDEAATAAERVEERWRQDAAGRGQLDGAGLGAVSDDFSADAAEAIRAWQGDLLELIRSEGQGRRLTARMASFGVNGVAVALMVVVFASTAGLTGLEIGIAGGSAVVGQKLLEAIFGEDAVRRLTRKAKSLLEERCDALLEAEAGRFLRLLPTGRTPEDTEELRRLAHGLLATRAEGEQ
ncbi:dynamin family protein [Zafaria sp. J156]|uniref:dynamin family protein n=1 Tax=Zafaria sp. J156 TaxID=3116490 RepID=UPI002E77EFB7|nr:dynamin family protein [Zafaria sp. J156]MEE1620757.1 dynamin family protein [Zafaria sp. J156]